MPRSTWSTAQRQQDIVNRGTLMANPLVLHYFNIRGQAEVIRLLLTVAGVDFVDDRIDFSEWSEVKPMTPGGTLPYIELNGMVYDEWMAITRFLARKYKMMGKTEADQFEVDILLCKTENFLRESLRFRQDSLLNKAQKAALEKKLKEVSAPEFLDKMEWKLGESFSGFIVGKILTVGDLLVFDTVETLAQALPELMENYPAVEAHSDMIAQIPSIAQYLETRPFTLR